MTHGQTLDAMLYELSITCNVAHARFGPLAVVTGIERVELIKVLQRCRTEIARELWFP
jgi:hypothetical protein